MPVYTRSPLNPRVSERGHTWSGSLDGDNTSSAAAAPLRGLRIIEAVRQPSSQRSVYADDGLDMWSKWCYDCRSATLLYHPLAGKLCLSALLLDSSFHYSQTTIIVSLLISSSCNRRRSCDSYLAGHLPIMRLSSTLSVHSIGGTYWDDTIRR